MATCTTFWDIRDNYYTKLEALTLGKLPHVPLRQCPNHLELVDYVDGNSSSFRKFELVRQGGELVDPPCYDPSALQRKEECRLTVAYPVAVALYGTSDLDEIEAVIRSDARLIRGCLFSAVNYLPGQSAAFIPELPPIDKLDPEVWFQSYPITLQYTEAQSLS